MGDQVATRRMVVTGCSSGFGLVIAQEALRRGWEVFGTVRRVSDGETLRQAGGTVGILDLVDEASCARCAQEIAEWSSGSLDCVIHNAGTAYPAPMVGADRADFRAQFEINTIGQIDFNSRLIGPLIAAKGMSIFISSISTQMPTALLGLYAASKRALEAMAESLSMEMGPLGLTVHVIRPGSYRTSIWGTAVPRGDKYLEMDTDLPESIENHYKRLGKKIRRVATEQPMADPEQFARFVLAVAEGRRRGFFHATPALAKVQSLLAWILPVRSFHRLIRWILRRA